MGSGDKSFSLMRSRRGEHAAKGEVEQDGRRSGERAKWKLAANGSTSSGEPWDSSEVTSGDGAAAWLVEAHTATEEGPEEL